MQRPTQHSCPPPDGLAAPALGTLGSDVPSTAPQAPAALDTLGTLSQQEMLSQQADQQLRAALQESAARTQLVFR